MVMVHVFVMIVAEKVILLVKNVINVFQDIMVKNVKMNANKLMVNIAANMVYAMMELMAMVNVYAVKDGKHQMQVEVIHAVNAKMNGLEINVI